MKKKAISLLGRSDRIPTDRRPKDRRTTDKRPTDRRPTRTEYPQTKDPQENFLTKTLEEIFWNFGKRVLISQGTKLINFKV